MIGQNENNIPGQDDVGENIKNGENSIASDWLRISRDVYETSTDYYENSIQSDWQRNVRNWNNKHPRGSKFHTESYKQRSKLFRPLTRTTERNSSAAVAASLFSNLDVIDAQPTDPTNPLAAAIASVMKELLQYRLKHDVKWYMTAMGAWQDTQVYGPCVAFVGWEFEEKNINPSIDPFESKDEIEPDDESGSMAGMFTIDSDEESETYETDIELKQPEFEEVEESTRVIVKDCLCIDLISPEYFRFDPAADWRDPVNTSPYVIRIVPMYVNDVREKMVNGEWNELDSHSIVSYGEYSGTDTENLRRAREGDNRVDSDSEARPDEKEFDLVYPREYFVKLNGCDYVYWTLGDRFLLTDPVPIEEVYFHGRRPFVYGQSVIEAHKTTPDSVVGLMADLQENVNSVSNQRMDNVQLAMNKRYIVKRGSNVDLAALARNVPGGSVTADKADDVNVVSTPDVTASSYAEVERLTTESNELTGTFSGGSVQNNRALNETVGGMQLLADGANQLQSFDIRTWVESWVQPVLEMAMLVLQHYETDEQILGIAGEKGLATFKEIDKSEIHAGNLFNTPLDVQVNVGLGATSPFQKVNNLAQGLSILAPYIDPARLNTDEIGKEVMGALGYGDGGRFIKSVESVQQEQQNNPPSPPPEVQLKQMELQAKMQMEQMEIQAKMQMQQMKMDNDKEIARMKAEFDMQLETMKLSSAENQKVAEIQAKMNIEEQKDKTNRDKTAVSEANKANELEYKRTTGNSGI